jgi:hypothetical protein
VGNGVGVGEGTKAEATGDRVLLGFFMREDFSIGLMFGFDTIRKSIWASVRHPSAVKVCSCGREWGVGDEGGNLAGGPGW